MNLVLEHTYSCRSGGYHWDNKIEMNFNERELMFYTEFYTNEICDPYSMSTNYIPFKDMKHSLYDIEKLLEDDNMISSMFETKGQNCDDLYIKFKKDILDFIERKKIKTKLLKNVNLCSDLKNMIKDLIL